VNVLRRFLQLTLHPAWYHRPRGVAGRGPFFEGWYFKLIDASERQRYAVIPGVFWGQEPGQGHAFVQVLDGTTGRATYHRYPLDAFCAADPGNNAHQRGLGARRVPGGPDDPGNDAPQRGLEARLGPGGPGGHAFEVRVGPNRFCADEIALRIESPARQMVGTLRFGGLVPWPVTLASPGIMGPFAWIPFMECYHGVLGLDHEIRGALAVDGTQVDMTGGRGYIEKDWGRSFPSAWVWMQTNHFCRLGTSLTASVAVIPWLGTSFRGFIAGLWHEGRLYRFATYSGARLERLAIAGETVELALRGRQRGGQICRLEIHAHRAHAGVLQGPSRADMGVRVPESLQSMVAARLLHLARGGERLLWEGVGRNAGIEVVGEVERLQ
jgi:tocopherol cyclase